jgi:hypothetical protein
MLGVQVKVAWGAASPRVGDSGGVNALSARHIHSFEASNGN